MKNSHLWAGMAAIAGVALFMAACSKNNNGPNASPKETKLASHTWYVNAVSMSTLNVTGTGGTSGDTTSVGVTTNTTTGTTTGDTSGTGTTGTTGTDTTGIGTTGTTTVGINGMTASGGSYTDSSFYTSCMHDDNLVFKLNHQFIFSNANTSCDSTTLPYGTGTWSFNTAEDTLRIKSNGVTMNWAVVTLSDSTLEVSFADSTRNVTTQLTFTSNK